MNALKVHFFKIAKIISRYETYKSFAYTQISTKFTYV